MPVTIAALGYARFSSPDLPGWERLLGHALGMMPVRRGDDDSISFRLDERAWRIRFEPSETTGLLATGWELPSRAAFEEALKTLPGMGVDLRIGTDQEAADRCVEQLAMLEDPSGNRLELFHTPLCTLEPLVLHATSGFVTGDMGLGHVVLPAAKLLETASFYGRVLGFTDRDSMLVAPPGRDPYRMRFLACNDRHHSLALTGASSPVGLRHLMVHAAEIGDVGRAFDRCKALSSCALRTTLGQHSNDLMVSFYVAGPGGIEIEFATGEGRLPIEGWTPRELDGFKLWGYEPLS